jgi:Ca2+-binding RTX toxin-like protein
VAVLALLGAALAAHATAAPGSQPEAPRCHGRRATIVGTAGNDLIHGTPGPDVIWGGPGNDVIYGGLGDDIICGGGGNDLIHGGRGNDWIDGGPGTDRVFGDLGDDKVLGGPGDRDEVSGGLGIDTVSGGPGNEDLVRGDYGYDRMDGGPGKGDIASFSTAVAGGRGSGVWASLKAHKAFGDGHDRLYRFESLEGSAFADTLIGDKGDNAIKGGPGNDTLIGGGGRDELNGGQGTDACEGGPVRVSCGREKPPTGSAYVQLDPSPVGGAGLQFVGGAGSDDITVAFDEASKSFGITAARGVSVGEGCEHPLPGLPNQVRCAVDGPARWLMVDLGPGNDRLRVEGSLRAVDFVRINGGEGDDVIRGGPEEDLIESGPGSDRIYGGAGDDGLIGGLPGPTYLYGGPGGDLLAAGGGCAGGALVGGPGRDDASFAETQAHPGTLYISLAVGAAWINVIRGCHKVRLRGDEDIEGSFDDDVLIGDSGPNLLLGQPGVDSFYGRGGEDTIDAVDGVKDAVIQCGAKGHPSGVAVVDSIDPTPLYCKSVERGRPVAGLHK